MAYKDQQTFNLALLLECLTLFRQKERNYFFGVIIFRRDLVRIREEGKHLLSFSSPKEPFSTKLYRQDAATFCRHVSFFNNVAAIVAALPYIGDAATFSNRPDILIQIHEKRLNFRLKNNLIPRKCGCILQPHFPETSFKTVTIK